MSLQKGLKGMKSLAKRWWFWLIIVLAAAPAVASAGNVIREMSPLIALFYLAAILERGWSYRAARRVNALC